MKFFLSILFITIGSIYSFASKKIETQASDSIVLDSTNYISIDQYLKTKPQVDISNKEEEDAEEPILYKKRSPVRAGIYSALLPGLGQAYNRKYWKAPIALGLVATGGYFIHYYDKSYRKYHRAFNNAIEGKPHDFENLTPEALAKAQDSQQRYRDYAILLTVLAYGLNILDASVDAHLQIFDYDKDLVVKPVIINDNFESNQLINGPKLGLSLNFNF